MSTIPVVRNRVLGVPNLFQAIIFYLSSKDTIRLCLSNREMLRHKSILLEMRVRGESPYRLFFRPFLCAMQNLRVLELSMCGIDYTLMCWITAHIPHLIRLDLSGNPLFDRYNKSKYCGTAAQLRAMHDSLAQLFGRAIEDLNLRNTNLKALQSFGMRLKQELPSLQSQAKHDLFPPHLRRLDLSRNGLKDEGLSDLILPPSIEYLNVSDNHLTTVDHIPLWNLCTLDIRENDVMHLTGLEQAPKLRCLKWSNRPREIFSTAAYTRLYPHRQLNNLEELHLRLIGVPVKCWTRYLSSNLQVLKLPNMQIGWKIVPLLYLPPSLRHLDLSGNIICENCTSDMTLPASLKTLHLERNLLTCRGVLDLSLPDGLLELNLADNYLSSDADMGRIRFPSALERLDLSNNHHHYHPSLGRGGPENGKKVAEAAQSSPIHPPWHFPPQLKSLHMDNCWVSDHDLGRLRLPPSLQELTLSHNRLKHMHNVYRVFSNLKGSRCAIDLSYNNLTWTASPEPMELPDVVQSLNLLCCNVRDTDISVLNQLLQCSTRMVCLNLSANHIGKAGLQQLAIPKGLRHLDLSWNQALDNNDFERADVDDLVRRNQNSEVEIVFGYPPS